ncbi:unnamed protein product [Owenia fusiformis]|uniref:Major facilitator superfamily (MFS) profile domain-containing protein n=1 Tax=Owenia fusiformis TaxID=6347 RepID=A0A8S4NWP6_OWEFU|nr:unnamed protein product [Owenia fusiformis]
MLVGVFTFGQASDKFGRKLAMIATVVVSISFTYASSFSPNYIVYNILRFIVAAAEISTGTIGYVLVLEIVNQKWRLFAAVVSGLYWPFGYMTLAGIAYLIRDWRYLTIAVASINVPYVIYLVLIMPDSPRWKYSQGKNKDGDAIMNKIAKWNNAKLPDVIDINMKENSDAEDPGKKAFFLDLLRTPNIRKNSLIQFYIWFVTSMVYYGLSLGAGSLSGSPYLNYLLNAAVEIPAVILKIPLMWKFGRIWPLGLTMIIGGVALLCVMAVPEGMGSVVIGLSLFGKCMLTMSFGIIYILTCELNPTVVRNVALGSSSMFARAGGICAPLLSLLRDYYIHTPVIVFGAMSVLAGFLTFLLPETLGKRLPETIQDAENYRNQDTIEVEEANASREKKVAIGDDTKLDIKATGFEPNKTINGLAYTNRGFDGDATLL